MEKNSASSSEYETQLIHTLYTCAETNIVTCMLKGCLSSRSEKRMLLIYREINKSKRSHCLTVAVKSWCSPKDPSLLQVVYRQNWRTMTTILETNKTSVELHIPSGEDYLIEIKALTEGGDGTSSGPIRIQKMSSK